MSDSDFTEQIIQEVEKRPIIWNTEHQDHHNKLAITNAWWAIAKALDQPEKTCQTRWRTLRDNYVKATNAVVKKTGSGATLGRQKSFAYIEEMSFLRRSIAPRKTETNIPVSAASSKETSAQISSDEDDTELNDIDRNIAAFEKPEDSDDLQLSPDVSSASLCSDLNRSSHASSIRQISTIKRKRRPPNTEPEQSVSQAFINKINAMGSNEDDLTAYGRYIACELRKFNTKTQYILKHKIDQLIFDTHMAELNDANEVLFFTVY